MTIYNDYTFDVKAIHPSGLPSYESGKAKATRKFQMECQYAEEFVLRQLGKFWVSDSDTFGPSMPAPLPFAARGLSYSQLHLVATSFNIEPLSACCFNVEWEGPGSTENTLIEDPTSSAQMERYWLPGESPDNRECTCIVTIGYEENPCDCVQWNQLEEGGVWEVNDAILLRTCISVERNPSYELFTLPNAPLVWSDLPVDENRRLKSDSYAYKVIPKADIIVSWHNVPVRNLGQIETHLRGFRGKVNEEEFGDVLFCDALSSSGAVGVEFYEPETIMFIDFQEDRAKRTDAFGGMRFADTDSNLNTTTLKLIFKQKRIDTEDGAVGWNHLFRDTDIGTGSWARVQVESTGEDLFELKSFSDILYPTL